VAKISVTLTFFLVVCIATSALAAPKPGLLPGAQGTERPPETEVAYTDPLGRSTPQGTVFGFMKSATQGDYERALQYLDTKKTGLSTQKLIVALQGILERGFSGNLGMLSNKPEGYLDANLPPSKDRVGTLNIPSGSIDILLERVQRGKEPPIWLFSAETLKAVSEHYKELDVRTMDAYLPKFLVNTWFLWFPLWQWFVILIFIPLSFGLATLVARLFTPLLFLFMRRIAKVQGNQHVVRLTGPVRVLIFGLATWSISLLSRSVLASHFWTYLASTLSVIGAAWLCVRLIDIVSKLKKRQLALTSSDKISMVQLVGKLSQILVLIIGALVIFFIAGINIAAALTGLGIGGIAIAFAAQKTLENLFGGIMIISDQPIRVGDLCQVGDHIGTVENIGLRSTRIRTHARTVVSVPNGQLAVMSLENFTMRDKIWFHHMFHLRYETTADQLRYMIAEVRKMLYQHPKIETPSARIRFVGFGSSSLDLEIFAYVLETASEVFLEIQEDLLLRVMGIIEASGGALALPSQTTYVTKDTRLNSPKSEAAIATVRQWREQGELPFPDFWPETIAEIDNRLEYPPPDSALRVKRKG
jgi:MscS family membrane protein